MKIFVTGVNGQLGHDVMLEIASRGYDGIGSDLQESSVFPKYIKLDITDEKSVNDALCNSDIDAVIHCAAWTAVDKAEENKELVYKINAIGPKNIALVTKKLNIPMIQISTDYVFDGKGVQPFETDSPKHGLSTYGISKSDGEDFVCAINPKHFIVRTTGVFGTNGSNFVKTMIKLANAGKKEINVVDDQIVSVTYTKDLAKLLLNMLETSKYGIYHAANIGYFSWCDFAKDIFSMLLKNVQVNSVSTEEYKAMVPGQTDRPKNSRLSFRSLEEAGFELLPNYKDALKRFLIEIGEL